MISFSIIVPIYNTKEKYLTRLIQSIRNKNYKNFEVIFINDNSNLEETNLFFSNFKFKNNEKYFFNDKNMGAGKTRNKGINNAKNDYIMFIDSDDIISNDYLFNLNELINLNKNFHVYHTNFIDIKKGKLIPNNSFIKVSNIKINGVMPWLYIIKRSFILENNCFFIEDFNFHEDVYFVMKLFLKTDKICVLELKKYFYERDNETSIMHKTTFSNSLNVYSKIISHFFLNDYKVIDENNRILNEWLIKCLYFVVGYGFFLEINISIFFKLYKNFIPFKKIKSIKKITKINLNFGKKVLLIINFSIICFFPLKLLWYLSSIFTNFITFFKEKHV